MSLVGVQVSTYLNAKQGHAQLRSPFVSGDVCVAKEGSPPPPPPPRRWLGTGLMSWHPSKPGLFKYLLNVYLTKVGKYDFLGTKTVSHILSIQN